jgi:hypothetical protein
MNRLTKRQQAILEEAARRYKLFEHEKDILNAWTGLGSYTYYKPVLDAGLMDYVHAPRRGSTQWFKLTLNGAAIVRMLLAIGLTGN